MTRRFGGLAAAVATSLGAHAAFAQPADTGYGRPVDVSLNGHLIDWLTKFCTISIVILFVIMVIVLGIAVLAHRDGKHKAVYEHGASTRHLVFIAVLAGAIFFVVDGTMLAKSYSELAEVFWNFPKSADTVEIEVLAQQWAWNIRYPGPDGKFNTEDDVITLNEMHIPVGKPVMLKIRSKDVIHSFYLPNFRTKIDAFPGVTSQLWFQATQTGNVDMGCAQHCGVNHYKMHGTVTIEPEADFKQWLNTASTDAKRRYDVADAEAHWGWAWEDTNG